MQVFNIANPTSPASIGSVVTDSNTTNIVIGGNYAYIINARDTSTLQVINISNPALPAVVGTAVTTFNPYNMALTGNYVYVAGYTFGKLQIFDVGNAAQPVLANTILDEGLGSITISGKYALGSGRRQNRSRGSFQRQENPNQIGEVGGLIGLAHEAVHLHARVEHDLRARRAADEDAFQAGLHRLALLEQFEAVHLAHRVIGDQQGGFGSGLEKTFQRQLGIEKLLELVAAGQQRNLGEIQQHRLIVHQINERRFLPCRPWRWIRRRTHLVNVRRTETVNTLRRRVAREQWQKPIRPNFLLVM